MYRILLPVDSDKERAKRQINTVQSLPRGHDVEVILLHVHEPIDSPGDEAGGGVIDEINQSLAEIQGTPASVEEAYESLTEAGFSTRVGTATGEPVDCILEVAADEDVDMIVIAGRERSPVGKALFGSVTQGVILRSDRPVTVAK